MRIHAGLSAALDQAVPAGAGRQERGDRDRQRGSRRGGRRRHALRVQSAEPEMQRHLAGVCATARSPTPFLERLIEKTRAIRMGDPTERDVFFGPVINRAVGGAVRAGRGPGAGGGHRAPRRRATPRRSLRPGPLRRPHHREASADQLALSRGAVRPLPRGGRGERPGRGHRRDQRVEYGLTAGIFSADPAEVERFFDEVEAGVCYANKRTGATTGAWPGAQAFCGWKGSGSTGKGGCGPYYVAQFMREQSRTVIEGCVKGDTPTRRQRVRDYPRIVVPPPGPKAQAVVRRDEEWTSTCYIKEYPLVVSHGRGAMVEDVDGNRYLDFMAGIAVSSTGYGHPKVVAAVKDAADRFLHICGSDFYYEGMAALCERLAKARAGPVQEAGVPHQLRHRGDRGGDQAGALRHPAHRDHRLPGRVPRPDHGRRDADLEQGPPARRVRAAAPGCAPRPVRLPLPLSVLRRRAGLQPGLHRRHRAGALRPPARPQRRGGHLRRADAGRGRLHRSACRAGCRTCASSATATASCWWRTRCSAASAAPGRCWPASTRASSPTSCSPPRAWAPACRSEPSIAKESITTWESGSHGSTFGGNPVCCAAALATLDLVEGGLMANAVAHGRAAHGRAAGSSKAKHACIGEVRGLGLMVGVEFVKDRRTREPAPELVHELVQRAFQQGLLLLGAGKSTLRLAPPLVVDEEDVDTALDDHRRLPGRAGLSAASKVVTHARRDRRACARRRHRRDRRVHPPDLLRGRARDHPPAAAQPHPLPPHARSHLRSDDRRRLRQEAGVLLGGESRRRDLCTPSAARWKGSGSSAGAGGVLPLRHGGPAERRGGAAPLLDHAQLHGDRSPDRQSRGFARSPVPTPARCWRPCPRSTPT